MPLFKDPSPEALEIARNIEQCDNAERVHCFAWQLQGKPCGKCETIALALDAFRAEGIEQERARLKNAIVPYDDLWAGERSKLNKEHQHG